MLYMDIQAQIVITTMIVMVVLLALWLFVYPRWQGRRREQMPFSPEWEAIVRYRLPFYDRMPDRLKTALHNQIKHFLANKRFVGCAGQRINDDVRVSIAAQACLLILDRPGDYYTSLHTIMVYPSEFLAARDQPDEMGLVSHQSRVLAGEAWSNGRIILSWDSVEKSAANFSDGFNVVLHEFAHQLDNQFGHANGAPWLNSHAAYQRWSEVFGAEFTRLRALANDPGAAWLNQQGEVLNFYGASEPAEFFAVATETFFEKPHALQARHPELFEQLLWYYRVDPRQWQ
jgi:MtfA peptidase